MTISTDEKERQALYFLMSTELFSNNTLRKLKNTYGSYEQICKAGTDLKKHIKENAFDKLAYALERTDREYLYSRLKKHSTGFYMFEDDMYPKRFRELHDAPCAILVKGRLPSETIPSVAVIGARKCSNFGSSMTEEYVSVISGSGIQVISGMAMGIDSIAGTCALKNGGPSFAVLGNGPDICYPAHNRQLYDELVKKGGIISEYTLGSSGVSWHFPLRNRLISALCDAVIVIEAKEKSGTMITVDAALEQGKDVYALPGRSCDLLSRGCNLLIKQGAGILISPEEFICDLLTQISHKCEYDDFIKSFSKKCESKPSIELTEKEKVVFKNLDHLPKGVDEILSMVSAKENISIADLLITLNSLAIKGLVTNISGTYFAIK